jgi:hypothetical protein
MADERNLDRDQNKDAQKSGQPVQLDKDKEQQGGKDDQHQGGGHQGGQQMPGREQRQGGQPAAK